MFGFVLTFLVVLVDRSSATLDCSAYGSDKEIILSMPFVLINPKSTPSNYTSYAIIESPGNVTQLHLNGPNSFQLPMFCFRSLQTLSINDMNFENGIFPSEVELLASSLTALNITNTPLTQSLPVELFKLTKLNTLILKNCDLDSVPDAIRNLSQLRTLDLRNNKLTSLPNSMSQLTQLTLVNVSRNQQLTSLHAFDGSDINILHASSCEIDSLPVAMPNLRDLDLSNNRLNSLLGIGTLSTKNDLFASFSFRNNQIESISTKISQCKGLKRIDLANNKLTSIPGEIYSMALFNLNVQGNNFSDDEIKWISGLFRRQPSSAGFII